MLMLQDNFSLSLCDTKLIILVAYSPLTEVKNRKFYIQLCSLLANGAGNLSKDSKNWSIFILCSYAKLHRYFSSLFLPCMSFANPVIFRTNSPYSPAWVVPHSTSIMCRGTKHSIPITEILQYTPGGLMNIPRVIPISTWDIEGHL